MIDYKIYDLAKKVRARAAAVIKNESEVIQTNERRVEESMEIISLCNMIISSFDSNKGGIVNLKGSRDEDRHPR